MVTDRVHFQGVFPDTVGNLSVFMQSWFTLPQIYDNVKKFTGQRRGTIRVDGEDLSDLFTFFLKVLTIFI